MSANLYDAEFYAARRPLEPEFEAMANVLFEVFVPCRCIDLGCGPGEILRGLARRDVAIVGVDSSLHAGRAIVSYPMFHADLSDCGITLPGMDLVLCLETAEHIPESGADGLVNCVARNTSKWLVWSAATPGQGGTGHINEQDFAYWGTKLEKQGLTWNLELSHALRLLFAKAAPRQPWYSQTVLVWSR